MSHIARETIHDANARFRVNEVLLASAQRHARQHGMSISELLRQALRRELREAA